MSFFISPEWLKGKATRAEAKKDEEIFIKQKDFNWSIYDLRNFWALVLERTDGTFNTINGLREDQINDVRDRISTLGYKSITAIRMDVLKNPTYRSSDE